MLVRGFAALIGFCALVLLVSAGMSMFGAVDRARVERFARRQGLIVTEGNGNAVIRYLATTRRWRGGLLCLALLAFLWLPVATRQGVTFNVLGAFGGWFVGAVIAEWRVDDLARGPQATALLRARRLTDYVHRPAVTLAALVWSVAGALAVISVVLGLTRSADRTRTVVTLAGGIVVAAAIAGVVRRILERPQPLVADDLLEADNAIRSRSLNVLLGSALAIGGYLVAVSADAIVRDDDNPGATAALIFGYLVTPLLGALVARRSPQLPTSVTDLRAGR